jgi:hypothetical protein
LEGKNSNRLHAASFYERSHWSVDGICIASQKPNSFKNAAKLSKYFASNMKSFRHLNAVSHLRLSALKSILNRFWLVREFFLNILLKRFISDAAKVWNKAPEKIRTVKTLKTAKKTIQEHCKSLHI